MVILWMNLIINSTCCKRHWNCTGKIVVYLITQHYTHQCRYLYMYFCYIYYYVFASVDVVFPLLTLRCEWKICRWFFTPVVLSLFLLPLLIPWYLLNLFFCLYVYVLVTSSCFKLLIWYRWYLVCFLDPGRSFITD